MSQHCVTFYRVVLASAFLQILTVRGAPIMLWPIIGRPIIGTK